MNGVRRFFAATNVVASSTSPPPGPKDSSPEPGSSPPTLPPTQSVAPLFISSGKQLYPLSKADSTPPTQVTSPTSPRTAQAGLFSRKDGPTSPRRKPVTADINGVSSPSTSNPRPSFDSFRSQPRSPTPPGSSLARGITNGSSRRPPEGLKPSFSAQDSGWKQASSLVNTRDELLMSLLASEAMVDSRGFEILSSEEVEELKREQQLLSSRLTATRKKLALETKIRDAAANLQKLQTVKRLSKQTSEELDAANRKVDLATKELSRLLERVSDIDRKLLEHKAGVLALSLRNLEAKVAAQHSDPSEDLSSRSESVTASRGLNSPSSSVTSSSNRTKFDGAHLFAGHADSVVPGSLRKKAAVDSAQVMVLEARLKETEDAAQAAREKAAELEKNLRQLQREKEDVEKNLDFDLQTAQETIMKMEKEMSQMERNMIQQDDVDLIKQDWERAREDWGQQRQEWDQERQGLLKERDNLEQERFELEAEVESRNETVQRLEQRVRDLEAEGSKGPDQSDQLRKKDEEIERLLNAALDDKQRWESHKILLQRQKQEELDRIRNESSSLGSTAKEELNAGLEVLYETMRTHRIPGSPTDTSLSSLASAISAHVGSLNSKLDQLEQEKNELDVLRRKYEDDVRNGWEVRERLGKEVEEARKEREDARKEVRALELQLKESQGHERSYSLSNRSATPPIIAAVGKIPGDVNKIIGPLRTLWPILPSVEARAARLGKSSVAELDVRTLKSLYDPKQGFNSPTVTGEFNVDEFVARVQALVADDRALIERLIRFAQSHDLLRNNAERAQKLAQESNKGLELYQAQVKSLEDRNTANARKQLQMMDEISALQQSMDIVLHEKHELENEAEALKNNIRDLSEELASKANSSGGNTAALEATKASLLAEKASLEGEKSALETKLAVFQKQLKEAEQEIEQLRSIEPPTQQMALLMDELNSLQQDNDKLRQQLRAKK